MTAARGTFVAILFPKESQILFVIVVATVLALVSGAPVTMAQTAQQQRPPTPSATTAPEDAKVTQLRERANAGEATAQFSLGFLYANGQGVQQDYTQAIQWYRKAAEQGSVYAQFNLGFMYANGQGVPQDYVEAHKWVNLAAARASGADQKRFADGRDALAKKMTPAQVAEAQKRAREWTEAFEKNK